MALDYEQEVETAKSSSAIKVTYELPNVISSLQGLNFLAVQIFFHMPTINLLKVRRDFQDEQEKTFFQ